MNDEASIAASDDPTEHVAAGDIVVLKDGPIILVEEVEPGRHVRGVDLSSGSTALCYGVEIRTWRSGDGLARLLKRAAERARVPAPPRPREGWASGPRSPHGDPLSLEPLGPMTHMGD